jgi:hypothetical protein
VKDFYAQFGFELVAEKDGHSQWQLDPGAYQPRTVYIAEKD